MRRPAGGESRLAAARMQAHSRPRRQVANSTVKPGLPPAHRVLASHTLSVLSRLPLTKRRLGSSTCAGSHDREVMNLRWPCGCSACRHRRRRKIGAGSAALPTAAAARPCRQRARRHDQRQEAGRAAAEGGSPGSSPQQMTANKGWSARAHPALAQRLAGGGVPQPDAAAVVACDGSGQVREARLLGTNAGSGLGTGAGLQQLPAHALPKLPNPRPPPTTHRPPAGPAAHPRPRRRRPGSRPPPAPSWCAPCR